MDTARLAEMMRATLSEDKNERDAAEEQLKQVKQYTPCAFGKKCENRVKQEKSSEFQFQFMNLSF